MPSTKSPKKDELPKFWFPHPVEGYALGEVLHHDEDRDEMNVRLLKPDGSTDKTANFHGHVSKPVNPKILDGVHDNTQLMHLHEPSLLFNLRYRYAKDQIYTYTGTPAHSCRACRKYAPRHLTWQQPSRAHRRVCSAGAAAALGQQATS